MGHFVTACLPVVEWWKGAPFTLYVSWFACVLRLSGSLSFSLAPFTESPPQLPRPCCHCASCCCALRGVLECEWWACPLEAWQHPDALFLVREWVWGAKARVSVCWCVWEWRRKREGSLLFWKTVLEGNHALNLGCAAVFRNFRIERNFPVFLVDTSL